MQVSNKEKICKVNYEIFKSWARVRVSLLVMWPLMGQLSTPEWQNNKRGFLVERQLQERIEVLGGTPVPFQLR